MKAPTPQQIQIAYHIEQYVRSIEKQGKGDAEILEGMYAYMDDFKYLLDTTQDGQMDLLCTQLDGFYRFAKLMENLARAIANGDIEAP